jgi:hypothetical protein
LAASLSELKNASFKMRLLQIGQPQPARNYLNGSIKAVPREKLGMGIAV